ncbi:MAG: CCA tRNA nucleotidyltransferase [Microthrixaceae bacterium]|nr:CCA tRNA nucleotidyltransferase [Microthrixaceae bacterium]
MIPSRADEVLAHLQPLASRFDAAGFRLYLVGGAVRDLFVGRDRGESHDLDLTTNALPPQIKAIVGPVADAVWTQGERFGTIGCSIDSVDYEITTHRAEAYTPDSRKPEVVFSDQITADLSRRDFTVNAMALEVTGNDPQLIDPYGGLGDLGAGVLRTPLTPVESFSDDPLRMMRAARFIAGYGLRPDPDLVASATAMSDRIAIVSAERIRDELCKLVVLEDPSEGLFFLNDTNLAAHFLPELPAMRLEQDPIHRHKDVLTHTVAVVRQSPPRLKVRLAALFHDIAKPQTRAIGPNGVSFHHHEVVGARMTRERMRALRFDKETVRDVSQLVFLHLRGHGYGTGWTDAAVRRFVRDAGEQLDDLIALTRADCTTRNKNKAARLSAEIDELETRIAELADQEALAAIRPDLDGQEVMEHLGLAPGPEVGRALNHLLELRIEHGPMDHDEAIAELDRWWKVQQG